MIWIAYGLWSVWAIWIAVEAYRRHKRVKAFALGNTDCVPLHLAHRAGLQVYRGPGLDDFRIVGPGFDPPSERDLADRILADLQKPQRIHGLSMEGVDIDTAISECDYLFTGNWAKRRNLDQDYQHWHSLSHSVRLMLIQAGLRGMHPCQERELLAEDYDRWMSLDPTERAQLIREALAELGDTRVALDAKVQGTDPTSLEAIAAAVTAGMEKAQIQIAVDGHTVTIDDERWHQLTDQERQEHVKQAIQRAASNPHSPEASAERDSYIERHLYQSHEVERDTHLSDSLCGIETPDGWAVWVTYDNHAIISDPGRNSLTLPLMDTDTVIHLLTSVRNRAERLHTAAEHEPASESVVTIPTGEKVGAE